jgi:hypothetical protein
LLSCQKKQFENPARRIKACRAAVGLGPFLDKASRLYDQKARAVRVIVEPYYGTDRDLIALLGVGFGLTGKSKRNLINVLK